MVLVMDLVMEDNIWRSPSLSVDAELNPTESENQEQEDLETSTNENTIVLPQSVTSTPPQEGPSAIQAVEDHHPAGKTLGEAPFSLTSSRNRLLVTIFNDEYADKDGGDVEKLAAIKDNTKMIQELLKSKFGYEMPSEDDPTIFEPGKFENQAKLVKTFEVFLKKWK